MHLKFLTGISYLQKKTKPTTNKKQTVVMEDVKRLSLHLQKSMENTEGHQWEEE